MRWDYKMQVVMYFITLAKWTLKTFDTATNSSQMLEANFTEYLNGFSKNVQEIIENLN